MLTEQPKSERERSATRVEAPFVALSRFVVANDLSEEVRAAFRDRPHLVDSAPGFHSMEVLQPVGNDDEFWLLTRWEDAASYERWHRAHTYRDSHAGIPKGLKLDPKETRITLLEHLCF